MRRLRRWLFACATALSLLVCLFAAMFWVANRYVRSFPPLKLVEVDSFRRYPSPRLTADRLGLVLQVFSARPVVQGPLVNSPGHLAWEKSVRREDTGQRFLGFRYFRFASIEPFSVPPGSQFNGYVTVVFVPYWFVVVCAAILPILWVRSSRARDRRIRRRAAGLCVNCGYDLRASGDKCPECGTPVRVRPAEA